MAQVLGLDIARVSEDILGCAITADTGMQITSAELDEMLGLSKPRIWSGYPIRDHRIQ